MSTSKAVGVFAYANETSQIEQLREFLNDKGANLPEFSRGLNYFHVHLF